MNQLDNQYKELILNIKENGFSNKEKKIIYGFSFHHNMGDGFPFTSIKKLKWEEIVFDLLWNINGETNVKFFIDKDINKYNNLIYKKYLDRIKNQNTEFKLNKEDFIEQIKYNKSDSDWVKRNGDLGVTLGSEWRSFKKDDNFIDQIFDLIYLIRTNPDSKNLLVKSPNNITSVSSFHIFTTKLTEDEKLSHYQSNKMNDENLTSWYSSVIDEKEYLKNDLLLFNEELKMAGIPQRKMSLVWSVTQIDVFENLLYDFSFFGLLLEILCKEVNMIPHMLVGNFNCGYINLNELSKIEEELNIKPINNLPKLIIKEKKERYVVDDFMLTNLTIQEEFKKPTTNPKN